MNTRSTAEHGRDTAGWMLRIATAALLGVDAQIHGHLAQQSWQGWHPITPAQLFAAEAVGAAIVGLALLVSARSIVWAVAALMGVIGVAAVVLTYYVNIPAIGPIPSMYEPIWTAAKTWSAVAEGIAMLLALYALRRQRSVRAADASRISGTRPNGPLSPRPVTIR